MSALKPKRENFCQWVVQQTANPFFVSPQIRQLLIQTASLISTTNISGHRRIHKVQSMLDTSRISELLRGVGVMVTI